jgi:U3 small nucleolar RNA-associated protein 14
MLPKLPHGFETREQYEKTIRVPLGKEWHTSATHQKLIKPKVKVQAGVVIHPMKFSV